MERGKDILKDLPRFSPEGEAVYNALLDIHSGDERIELFARRFARAVTAFEAGNLARHGPLERFLLCGTSFSPIPFLVRAAAEAWLGKPWDGTPAFTYVDCNAFHTVYPGLLTPLIGPFPPDALGTRPLPLLAQINYPHFKIRKGKDLQMLDAWYERFQKEEADALRELSGEAAHRFSLELRTMVSEVWMNLYEEDFKKKGPFGSILFFDGVDHASQPLQELILRILRNGFLILPTGERVDFGNTIVILATYRDDDVLSLKSSIGFGAGRNTSYDVRSHYYMVRKSLFSDASVAAFVQAVAENLVIVNERTRESQRRRAECELEKAREICKELDIDILFTKEFQEGFLEDTKEVVFRGSSQEGVYTEERIESGVKRHIFDAIHRLILEGKLRRGSSLLFDRGGGEKFTVCVVRTKEGTGNTLTPQELQREGSRNVRSPNDEMPPWLTRLAKQAKQALNRYCRP